ncbi:MAG: C39 family peptidase [Rhodospirillales bacterium]
MLLAVAMLYAAATSGIWLDVPYIRQEENGCGAASIAMVMQYWKEKGASVSAADAVPEAIQRRLYSRRAKGIYASDMEGYFREKGFQVFAFRGEWADLEQHIRKGRPLIVCLRQGGPLHYVVVAGVDDGFVLLNDPARRKLLKLDREGFERDWKDRWTLLAVPRQAP